MNHLRNFLIDWQKKKNTFVWKEGELEDFLLDGDDAFTKIKNILGQEELFANPNKTKGEKNKKSFKCRVIHEPVK